MTDYSIKRFHKYTDNELIEQLRAYAKNLEISFVSAEGFSKSTGISEATVARHFGSWKEFCWRARLALDTRDRSLEKTFSRISISSEGNKAGNLALGK